MTDRGLILLAIFAHPDDETFRPGGTLALLAQHGVRVEVLTFTHGEAGSCGDPPLCTPEELPAMRERELRCACDQLGIKEPYLLDYVDGRLPEADAETMITQILSAVNELRPQILMSFGSDGLSGHPDHIAVGQWTNEAFRRTEGIVALYTVAVPQSLAKKLGMRQIRPVADDVIALSVDVSTVWETKLAAMRCYATQVSSSPMMGVPVERQRLFFGREYFVRAAQRSSVDDCLPDILKGYLQ
jgi:LmbE family N-acetylglucosaminyl deacetylase